MLSNGENSHAVRVVFTIHITLNRNGLYFSYSVLSTQESASARFEIMKTLDKIQNEAAHEPRNVQSDVVKKLMEKEQIFAVFEEQEERLLRMEINCENLLQKQVHSQPHRIKAHSHQAKAKAKAKNFFDV